MEPKKPYLKIIIAIVSIVLVILIVGGFYYFKINKIEVFKPQSSIFSEDITPKLPGPPDSEIKFSKDITPAVSGTDDKNVIFSKDITP